MIYFFYFANRIREIIPELIVHMANLFHNFSVFKAPNIPNPMIPELARPTRVRMFSFNKNLVAEVAKIVETAKETKAFEVNKGAYLI